nr:hypothetical protein [Candidatus Njordarchaeota archaeon]
MNQSYSATHIPLLSPAEKGWKVNSMAIRILYHLYVITKILIYILDLESRRREYDTNHPGNQGHL